MPDSLPVIPGHRFAYDIDGTYVSRTPLWGGTFTALDPAVLNDEDGDYHEFWGYRVRDGQWLDVAFAFPEPRTLLGYYVRWGGPNNGSHRLFTSVDTTDGTNGTWVNQQQWLQPADGPAWSGGGAQALTPFVRTGIQTCSYPNVRGLRFRFFENQDGYIGRLWNLHLYGYTAPTESLDRLEYWDPVLNQQADKAALNFGDLPQGITETKTIRVKNLSASRTATGIVLSANNSAGGATNLASGLTFSLDGTTWSASLNIGNLAPGAVSPVITVRRVVSLAEGSDMRAARVVATPTTF